ncbi:MAG TPA: cobalamin-independent methionine synthase II family protein [Candidatus Angelobacter sp.]|jgi:5-methyltetrahydropteroyltriglutamate--homocysteine methyltransferase|nr:cobalamin-independent methionine synthase II family protein [Candidatus Angelobacter sp.]
MSTVVTDEKTATQASDVIRSEVVGSLLRPDYLKVAREQRDAVKLSDAEFKAIEDRAVDEAITLQTSAGIDVITDGEQRRYAFYGHLIDAIDGFDKEGGWAIPFRDESGDQLVLKRPVVVERLRWRRSMAAEEWTYVRARTSHLAKVTLISAQQAAAYYDPEKSKSAYPTRDAYLADIVDLTRREISELRRLGCTYVQIDAPQYAALLDPELREGYRKRGSDPDRLIDMCIELDNAMISDQPGMTFGLHICRGNNQSHFYAQGGYEPIARIFQRSRFNRFLLEYDDQRSGGFEPLRHVPHDRFVVLGLVTTKKRQLEIPDELEARIEEASVYFPRERLALSPQCGFASTLAGNRLSPEDQRKKLELAASTARQAFSSPAAAGSRSKPSRT